MTNNGMKIMDSDMHVLEPSDLWQRFIEPKYRDYAPIGATRYEGDLALTHEGRLISPAGQEDLYRIDMVDAMSSKHGRTEIFKDYERRNWSPDTQVDGMDREGIDKAVLFPSRGLYAHAKEYDDDKLAAAISRAYNNWLAQFCSYAPERMYGAAMLPAQNIDAAVQEVRRAKQELGFRGVFLRPNPVRTLNWHNPVYDPLWAECEAQNLAVVFHEGIPSILPSAVADRFDGRHEDLWATQHVAAHPIEMMYVLICMIMGGVCERFPKLRIACLEANCSWLPYWLWRMDEHFEHREESLKGKLRMLPSEYFKRQCFVSVEADESIATHTLQSVGDDNIVFSTDFPHEDSAFPNAVNTFLKQDFPKRSKQKILWDNCARLYQFS